MKPVNHECVFYSSDSVLLDSVTPFVAGAIEANGAAIVVATGPHRRGLIEKLENRGIDAIGSMRRGTYVSLDAADTLSTLFTAVGDPPFLETFSSLVESVAKTIREDHPRIAIFGECVGLLYTLGQMDAAIEFETKGNELIERYKEYRLDILCGYPALRWKQDKQAFESICAEHSAVHIG